MQIAIRPAGREHFKDIQNVELAAFETLRAAGAVFGSPMASSDAELERCFNDGFLLGAFTHAERLIGYASAYIVENEIYVAELDVHPDFQRQGIGRRLMMALLSEAATRGFVSATLTTDRLAPFNMPFYAALGFKVVEPAVCPAYLLAILNRQIAAGLDPARRVAMRFIL
ncbi:GNAT family N-acetyltransferase [Rhizobium sp. L1K21]|uniref:GNAT family N-acetyltransferase n=1 Tax=Rhizobium sp. L1K21 TaxID=2954933 RepID=UPI00209294C0|nr:GNAT family N-acetyltransferase [Rhizobium sp. L1K21]MCO6186652.1 GNAT family N-acetyltransferase [Rhizobium sp. L1K21]